jgi:trimeric autotransporter adhesin
MSMSDQQPSAGGATPIAPIGSAPRRRMRPEGYRGPGGPSWVRRGVPIALGGLVITGAGIGWAHAGSSAPAYRTATAVMGDVAQQVNLTGTLAKVSQGSATFTTSGIVTKVDAKVGDRVSAGQILAEIDPTSLNDAVIAAQATLAQQKASLVTDENAAVATTTAATSTPSASPTAAPTAAPTASTGGASGSGGTTAGTPAANLTTQVNAIVKDSTAAATALSTAQADVTVANNACKVTPTTPADTASQATAKPTPAAVQPAPTTGPAAAPTASAAPTDSAKTAVVTPETCQAALQAVTDDLAKVAADQQAVTADQQALTSAMNAAVAALTANTAGGTAAGSSGTSKTAGTSTAKGASSGQSGGQSGGQTQAEHNARIAVDEAAIEAAQNAVTTAQHATADAVLRAPIAGVVTTVPFSKGAESGSQAVDILGNGGMQVAVNVPMATASKLTAGMPAVVTAVGSTTTSTGTVSSVGVLPVSSGSTPTYPVVILVPAPGPDLVDGATAAVTITLSSLTGVLTVPNSALVPTGTTGTSYVTVLQKGRPSRVTVHTGTVGAATTQVLDGLTAGEVVELANPSTAVPASSATAAQLTAPRGGGGFGGARGGAGGGGTRAAG